MTIETAVFIFAAGSILVAGLIWQTNRLTSRRLGNIEKNLDTLRQEFHWLFLKDLNRKSEETTAPEPVKKSRRGGGIGKAPVEALPRKVPDMA
jgi:hypothetical protein